MIWTGLVIGVFMLFHLAHYTFGWVHAGADAPDGTLDELPRPDRRRRAGTTSTR